MQLGGTEIKILLGDITEQDTDAIVNAANPGLLGGGGVDGAIHRAGGPRIMEECRRLMARRDDLSCGEAVMTSGGNLRAKHVIHTVGPIWHRGYSGDEAALANCYRNSIKLAKKKGLHSISFPAIGTGAYCCPIKWTAPVVFRAVLQELPGSGLKDVRFVLFSQADLEVYQEAWSKIAPV